VRHGIAGERLSAVAPSVVDMRHQHHSIDYVEIYVDDVPAAKQFYGTVFGWRFNDYGDAYAGIQAPDGDGELGGITVGDDRGASPLVLVISEELDASLAAVTDAGGEVVEGPFDYPGGRRFHFRDPSGNTLGVFQPSDG
jgi:predicted enzyme related to lactoylglutathione lyase